jgi:hypothetical protein
MNTTCKYCQAILPSPKGRANHEKWCKLNPVKSVVSDSLKAKLSASIKTAWANGTLKGIKHTDEAKEKISKRALASDHRRLLKSTRKYTKVDGSIVLLDSSWEEALAKRLDEIGVEWERPTLPILWKDSFGKDRKYFPDFFLPKFKIYLDPKNSSAKIAQAEKITWLELHRPDVQFLWSLQDCLTFKPAQEGSTPSRGAMLL